MVKFVWLQFFCLACLAWGAWADRLPEVDGLPYFPPAKLERLPACEQVTIQAYRQFGSHNPKWDPDAEQALLLYARLLCFDQAIYGTTNWSRLTSAAKRAIAAGCDDPLMISLGQKLRLREPNIDPRPALAASRAMIARLERLAYPPEIRAGLYLRAAVAALGESTGKAQATAWLEPGFTNLAQAVARKAEREDLYELAGQLFGAYRSATGTPQQACDLLQVEWNRHSLASNHVALAISASLLLAWTDDTPKTSAGANKGQPSAGFQNWIGRVEQAEDLLEQAWRQDPTDFFVCKQRLIALSFQLDKSAQFEKCFEQCRKLKPDDYGLYATKLGFFERLQRANKNLALTFGRQCFEAGDWIDQIPFILLDAHMRYAGTEYFQQPDVWEELQKVHEGYLKRFPGNNVVRSSYCYCACVAERWDLAASLLKEMGDLVVPSMFHGRYPRYLRAIRQQSPVR